MQSKWLVILLGTFILGCSSADNASYDTAGNPSQFPQAALDLIERIDNDNLIGFDSITFAFGELYTSHSDLLDDPAWKEVIANLGLKFGRTAEEHDARGREGWKEAAEYYQLAAFARPDDTTYRKMAAGSSAWLTAVNQGYPDLAILDDAPITIDNLTPFLRHFLLGGADYEQFYRERLHSDLTSKIEAADILNSETVSSLRDLDRALYRYAGVIDPSSAQPLVSFENPAIDLFAAEVRAIGPHAYRAEMYLIPRAYIPRRLALLVIGTDTNGLPVPVSILPTPSAQQWETDEMVAVSYSFGQNQKLVSTELSLVLEEGESGRFLYMSGSTDSTFALDPAALIGY